MSENPSLLDQIIHEAQNPNPLDTTSLPPQGVEIPTPSAPGDPSSPVSTPPSPTGGVETKRKSLSPALLMKFLGAVFLVALIFFGSVLAYIAFNPSQAQFFVSFGINPNDVKSLLTQLINAIFGVLVMALAVFWIIILFRAIWTSKDMKRLRLIRWLMAGVSGIFLFSSMTLWAILVQTIDATDYSNPSGSILLYENDLYNQEITRDESRISETNDLIGPVHIRFDISANAKRIQDRELAPIEGYRIDFDGAICNNDSSIVEGSDPFSDKKTISCVFDTIGVYEPKGIYMLRDRDGTPREAEIIFPKIDIKGVVAITRKRIESGTVTVYDASSLRNLGTPRWQEMSSEGEKGVLIEKPSLTIEERKNLSFLCLQLSSTACDRIFVLAAKKDQSALGKIIIQSDEKSTLSTQFLIEGFAYANQVEKIEWYENNRSICGIMKTIETPCKYTFNEYGKQDIKAIITLANNEEYQIEESITIDRPFLISKHIRVYSEEGKFLNEDTTYRTIDQSYHISDRVDFPSRLTFDANDIIPEKSGYILVGVDWIVTNGKDKEPQKYIEKKILELDIAEVTTYEITANYTFSNAAGEKKTGSDRVKIEIQNRDLIPILDINRSSDYLPVTVTVDASASRSKHSEIKKFLFDFGEGREPIEGDAIQTYEYLSAGEKTITLTIIDEAGNRVTKSEKLIIKNPQKTVGYTTSLSPGAAGVEIDFTPEANGSIEQYIWSFGDNTPTVREPSPSHTFAKAGNYEVSLTVRYTDGTIKTEKKRFLVE